MKINLKTVFCFIILVLSCNKLYTQSSVSFAVIGDYGEAGPDELAVANLVKSWNPNFIITLGDNNYDIGSASTIDRNIGQYYHEFIHPYFGSYGQGDTVNRFFPSLGNHDWLAPGIDPYLNYFSLPGNERYYDYVKGPVHFFVIDSDTNETDGIDSSSVQAQWLKNSLAVSSSRFNIVYFHDPPYCSGFIHGSEEIMRWPFKQWGASTVMAAHEHLYERITRNGLTYFVNGLGGNLRSFFGFPISGSQVRYSANYGAMLVNTYEDSLVLKFYNISGSLIDNYKILSSIKILSLRSLMEGFYNSIANTIVSDTVKIFLRNITTPHEVVDSSKGILSSSGTGTFNFSKANNATEYYIVFKHRNSLETWSAAGNKFTVDISDYNFTTSSSQAYGNNLILIGTKYCIYSGDVNQDGVIDGADQSFIDNDSFNFISGYVVTDVNGDNFVDASDLSITDNNSSNFVTIVRP